jgi:hypothetical protein
LKLSAQQRYRGTLNLHLLPACGNTRLCDIGTLDLQRFILQKMECGLGWESCSHLHPKPVNSVQMDGPAP